MLIWFILIGIPMLFGLYAQYRVSSAYNRNLQIPSRGHITGAEAAEAVMKHAGITDVEIVEVEGHLTDHYDPSQKRLALSSDIYRGTSLASLGIAAHESGHAIQHKVGYMMMKFRQNTVPAVQFVAPFANYGLMLAIVLIGFLGMKGLGIMVLQAAVVAMAVVVVLLAVEIAVTIQSQSIKTLIGGFFFIIALIFVYRSFYGMRIPEEDLNADEGKSSSHAEPAQKKKH